MTGAQPLGSLARLVVVTEISLSLSLSLSCVSSRRRWRLLSRASEGAE
jgi:hypothetical protein